jgi:hypothetical protein
MFASSDASHVVVNVASAVSTAGILACVSYLRGISKRLRTYGEKQFSDELYLLDHDRRLERLEAHPRRSA